MFARRAAAKGDRARRARERTPRSPAGAYPLAAIRSRLRTSHHGYHRSTARPVRRGPCRNPRADRGRRQRRAEADRPHELPALRHPRARPRSARRADPPGLLLRHARPGPQQGRRRRARAARPGQGRGLGRQAAARRAGGHPSRDADVGQPRRRGRRDARGLCLLGDAEGRRLDRRGQRGSPRRSGAEQGLLQGAARRSTRSTRPRASASTISRPSDRSSSSSSRRTPRGCVAGWSPRCGCTPTGRACSSCRPGARGTRPSRSPPKAGPSSPAAASTSRASR